MTRKPDAVEFAERSGGVEFNVKVVPGSSRNKLVGTWKSALRITVVSPPEGGKANREVARLLAGAFGVKPTAVWIIRGQTQPLKRVRIDGLSGTQLKRLLAGLFDDAV